MRRGSCISQAAVALSHTGHRNRVGGTGDTEHGDFSVSLFWSFPLIWSQLRTALEKAMAPHCSTLAWKIPWMASLVGCSPRGLYESDTTEQLHFHFSLSCTGEGNGNPLVFLPGESRRRGSLVGCRLWGRTELDTTEAT